MVRVPASDANSQPQNPFPPGSAAAKDWEVRQAFDDLVDVEEIERANREAAGGAGEPLAGAAPRDARLRGLLGRLLRTRWFWVAMFTVLLVAVLGGLVVASRGEPPAAPTDGASVAGAQPIVEGGAGCPIAGAAVTVPWSAVDGAMRQFDGHMTIDAMVQPTAAAPTTVTIDPGRQEVSGSLDLPFERVPGSGIVTGDAAAKEYVEGTMGADYSLRLSAVPADGSPPEGYPPDEAYHWESAPGACVFSGPVDLDLSMAGYVATGVARWEDPPREEVTYGEARGDIRVPAVIIGLLEPVDGGWTARLQVEFVSPPQDVPSWYVSVHASHGEPIPGLS